MVKKIKGARNLKKLKKKEVMMIGIVKIVNKRIK